MQPGSEVLKAEEISENKNAARQATIWQEEPEQQHMMYLI